MKKLIFIILAIAFLTQGCSIVSVGGSDIYRKDTGRLPREKALTMDTIGSMATAATSINKILAQIYYEGCDAKSRLAKVAFDFSYRVMGFLGVGWEDVDFDDAESIKMFYDRLGSSLKEKESQIQDLKKQVEDHRTKAAQSDKWSKTKEKEALTWKDRFLRVISSIIGFIIGLSLVAVLIQMFTGIPVLKLALGGIFKLYKGYKQTIEGIQEYREELKSKAEEDQRSQKRLEELDDILDSHHDESTKAHIDKIRSAK